MVELEVLYRHWLWTKLEGYDHIESWADIMNIVFDGEADHDGDADQMVGILKSSRSHVLFHQFHSNVIETFGSSS